MEPAKEKAPPVWDGRKVIEVLEKADETAFLPPTEHAFAKPVGKPTKYGRPRRIYLFCFVLIS